MPVLGARLPVGSAGTKGYKQASFLSFFGEALGFEGWVRVWVLARIIDLSHSCYKA